MRSLFTSVEHTEELNQIVSNINDHSTDGGDEELDETPTEAAADADADERGIIALLPPMTMEEAREEGGQESGSFIQTHASMQCRVSEARVCVQAASCCCRWIVADVPAIVDAAAVAGVQSQPSTRSSVTLPQVAPASTIFGRGSVD